MTVVARIAGFETRAELGMASPTSVSYRIDPSRGGCTGHYFGPTLRIEGHDDCRRQWLGAQRFHMRRRQDGGRGMVDIAYTGGYCDHGVAFPGRGLGVRTGANGTTAGNWAWYAFAWVGGEGETPTVEAFEAFAWWVVQARRHGGAADGVVPHSFHKPTGCPGNPLRDRIPELHNQPIEGDRAVTTTHFAQGVVGANATDLEQGRVAAQAYQAVLLLAAPGRGLTVVGPHLHAGAKATVGFAWPVGSAADRDRFDHRQFPDGYIPVVGGDRNGTAKAVAQMLLDHPPRNPDGSWAIERRGRPW